MVYKDQHIKCRKCGWEWNTSESDESDKYVCHKCGFDNTTYYDSNVLGNGGGLDNSKNKNQENDKQKSKGNSEGNTIESKAIAKEVRYNGENSITSRGRSQSDTDDARRLAKEKIKTIDTNASLRTANKYNLSHGLPTVTPHKYKKSDEGIQTEIANMYPKLLDINSNDFVATPLQKTIYNGYKKKYPKIISEYKIKDYKDLVKKSYAQLILEIQKQYDILPIHVSFHEGDMNYENSADMLDDVHNFAHMWVYKGGDNHPELGDKTKDENGLTANDKFRAVHDYFGHSVEGYEFGKHGEENAWIEHSKMLSPLAQWALSSETRGQNSWVNYSGVNKDVLETIRIGSSLKKMGLKDGNEEMVKEGQSLLDTVYDNFVFADQKAIVLPVEYSDTSSYHDVVIKDVPQELKMSGYKFKEGGEVGEHKETYAKWKSLVNMSKSELQSFYNSKEGKEAGLTPSQATNAGIDSGRESARMIMKMKNTPVGEWTENMWRWAKKQISFISRMSGVKGALYDDKGNKTRKHTSLLIWGHNPEKMNNGGDVEYYELDYDENDYNNPSTLARAIVDSPNHFKFFDGDYEALKNSRLIFSTYDEIVFKNVEQQFNFNMKPTGLWYGIGLDWAEFISTDMHDRALISNNLFKIDVTSKVLNLKTIEDAISFTNKYKSSLENQVGWSKQIYNIDWNRVSQDWSGIEVADPSSWCRESGYEDMLFWLYPWDVPSGCVWNEEGIISIEPLVKNWENDGKEYKNGGMNDKYEISDYWDIELYAGGGEVKTKKIITDKIGWSEAVADYFIAQDPKLAVWLADIIMNWVIINRNNYSGIDFDYAKSDWLKMSFGEKKKAVGKEYSTITEFNRIAGINLRNLQGQIRSILDWLKHPITPKQDLKSLTFTEAYQKSVTFHEELKLLGGDMDYVEPKENEILLKYPIDKDGAAFYWVHIPSSYCNLESSRMGHCGRTWNGNTLISLRSVKPYGKGHTINDSHVTIAYNEYDGIFYQVKGKRNQKPSEKYYPYIFDLIKNLAVKDRKLFLIELEEQENDVVKRRDYVKNKLEKHGFLSNMSSTEINSYQNGNPIYNEEFNELKKEVRDLEIYQNTVRNNREFNAIIERIKEIDARMYEISKDIIELLKEMSVLDAEYQKILDEKDDVERMSQYGFNGFGIEYDSSQDYSFEEMTTEQIEELYILNPKIFEGLVGEIILYEKGITKRKPNTTFILKTSAEYVDNLLNLGINFRKDFIYELLNNDIDFYNENFSSKYIMQNYFDEINKENINKIEIKISEITGLPINEVVSNGAEYYLGGDYQGESNLEEDYFDVIFHSISRAINNVLNSNYYNYVYKELKKSLGELGNVIELDNEGVKIEIDLANYLTSNQISSYYKDFSSDLENIFFEAKHEGDIKLPNFSIDERYSPYASAEEINEYLSDEGFDYEDGGIMSKGGGIKFNVKVSEGISEKTMKEILKIQLEKLQDYKQRGYTKERLIEDNKFTKVWLDKYYAKGGVVDNELQELLDEYRFKFNKKDDYGNYFWQKYLKYDAAFLHINFKTKVYGLDHKEFEGYTLSNLKKLFKSERLKQKSYEGGGVVERVLWAVKIGEPDWKEEVITNKHEQFENAKIWLSENGYDRIREAVIDLNVKPNFTKTIKKEIGGELENKKNQNMMQEFQFNKYPNISKLMIGENLMIKEAVFGGTAEKPKVLGTRYMICEVIGNGSIPKTLDLKVITCVGTNKFKKGQTINRPIMNILTNGRSLREDKNLEDLYMGDMVNYKGKTYEVGGVTECSKYAMCKDSNGADCEMEINDLMNNSTLVKRK